MHIFILCAMLLAPLTVHAATVKVNQVSALGCISLTETITYGSTDARTKNQVSQLQNFLIQRGFLAGKPTGVFTTASLSALKKYQLKSLIADVGVTDQKTRERIKKDTCNTVQTTATQKNTVKQKKQNNENVVSSKLLVTKTITTTVKNKSTGEVLGSTTTVQHVGGGTGSKVLVSSVSTTTKSSYVSSKANGTQNKKIQILTPFAGFTVKAGYPTNITWSALGYERDTDMRMALVNSSVRESENLPIDIVDSDTDISVPENTTVITEDASSILGIYKNSGIYSWSVPNELPYGSSYRMYIAPADSLEDAVLSEPFTILGVGLLPVIKSIRTSKISQDTYIVTIVGENLRDSLSVKYYLSGREVGNTDAGSIKFFGTTKMQYTITNDDMEDMPKGVYYKTTVYDNNQESEPKNIVFW